MTLLYYRWLTIGHTAKNQAYILLSPGQGNQLLKIAPISNNDVVVFKKIWSLETKEGKDARKKRQASTRILRMSKKTKSGEFK